MANTTFQNLAVYIAHELNQITSFVNENTTNRPVQTQLISTEESVRLSSDNSIVDLINTTVSGQTQLEVRLSTEEEIRAQQIGDLAFNMSTNTQSLIQRISIEESTHVEERASLNTRISTDESIRLSIDTSVVNKIDNDISTTESSRNSLIQQAIDDLVDGAPSTVDTLSEIAALIQQNDSELSTILSNQVVVIQAISTDESQRLAADQSFDTRLTDLDTLVGGGQSSLNTRVSTAESVRDASVDSLDTRVTIEEADFSGELSVLESKEVSKDVRIFADISTRISEIDSLDLVKDDAISTRISIFDSAEVAYSTGDQSISDRLDLFSASETSGLTSIETRLQAEESTRAAEDAAIDVDITSLETRESIDEDNLTSYQEALGLDIVNEYSTEFRFTTLPLVSGREIEVGTNYFADTVDEIYGTLYDVLFDPSGTIIYEIFDIGINQINLAEAGNVTSTRTFVQSVTVEFLGTSLLDGFFKPDGTKFYGLTRFGKVWEYTLSTAWDISTLQFNAELDVSVHGTMPLSIDFNAAGTKLFYGEQVSETLYEYDLSVAWDITTGVYNTVNTPLV